MNTLREDTTATQEVVGALIFSVLLVASLSAGYVVIQDQVEAEYAPDATVEQSSIEAKSTDQLAIKPLVGDDVDLENAEVRVIFEDRNAPDAVLTDLQAAKDHSTQVQVSDTQTIQTAGEYKPINQTVTYYEQNGTTDQVELDVYKWGKEVEVEKQVRRYEVWNDSGDKKTVDSASGPPEKYDHSNEIGTVKRYEVTSGRASTTCYDVKKSNCDFSWFYDRYGYSGVDRSYDKETVTETITVEYPKQPGDGWEKASDEPVGTNTYELENPVPKYDEKQKEVTVGYKITNTTQEIDRTETVYVASENAPEADTGDDSMLATLAPVGVAEGGWGDDTGSAWDDFYGDDTGESESSDTGDSTETNDTTETDESSGSDWFLACFARRQKIFYLFFERFVPVDPVSGRPLIDCLQNAFFLNDPRVVQLQFHVVQVVKICNRACTDDRKVAAFPEHGQLPGFVDNACRVSVPHDKCRGLVDTFTNERVHPTVEVVRVIVKQHIVDVDIVYG